MKKYIILLPLILFCISTKSQSFYGGLDLGVTISQVDGDNNSGYHKITPSGGVFVRNTFVDSQWGFSASILYKYKGSNGSLEDEAGNIINSFSINLQYVEIPVMLNYNVKNIAIPNVFDYKFKNDFYLEFGLSYGYLIQGEKYYNKVKDPYQKFNKYEIATQLGFIYRLSQHFYFNYRFSYTIPLLPIAIHPGGQTYRLNRGMYNNNMCFSVRYEF